MNKHQKHFWHTARALLHHNVPRFIAHIKNRGGVHKEEWEWIQHDEDSPEYPIGIIMRADEYLLFPKDMETFEKSLLVLVKALAIMSFVSGGIRFFGLHFCSQIDGFVVVEHGAEEA